MSDVLLTDGDAVGEASGLKRKVAPPAVQIEPGPSDVKRTERFKAARDPWIGARIVGERSASSLAPPPLRKKRQVA
jgi:hypothetical protein